MNPIQLWSGKTIQMKVNWLKLNFQQYRKSSEDSTFEVALAIAQTVTYQQTNNRRFNNLF